MSCPTARITPERPQDMEELVDNDVLRQAPLFSALDDEAATALRASMAETKLRRGEVLFHKGDSGDRLYVGNLEGRMTVLRAGRQKELLAEIEMDAPIYSRPIVVGDAMYLATYSRLYLIAAKAPY